MAAHGSSQAEQRHQDYIHTEIIALAERVRVLEQEVREIKDARVRLTRPAVSVQSCAELVEGS